MPPPAEAPYELVPAGPRWRQVAWPQVAFVVLAVVAGLAPLGIALALAA
ncbi:MAG: hypothetical protein AAGK21_15240 [Bacteroidota bacterium]